MVVTFEDDKHDHKESDIEKIQTSTHMYNGYTGKAGSLQLAREIINNGIDELTNPKSIGNNIDIFLDTITNTLTVADDGRGTPFEYTERLCTKLQAGSKLTREGSAGAGAGQNGAGLTNTNALSSVFEITSRRLGQKQVLKFEKGIKISDEIKKAKGDDHGLTVTFTPNPFFMTSHDEDCSIDHEQLMDWLEMISYLIPESLTIKLQVRLSTEKMINKKYVNKEGQLGLIKKLINKPLVDPIIVSDIYHYSEISRGEEYERYIGLEAAIGFSSSSNELTTQSFCNYINNIDGGTHIDAVLRATTRFFTKALNDKLSDRDKAKFSIVNSDIQRGMYISINVGTNAQPEFSGQVKEKATSKMFTKVFYDMGMVNRGLINYFKANPKALDKIFDLAKANAKARIAATEEKSAIIKKSKINNLELLKNKRFRRSNVNSIKQYSEILVVEGDSAGGGISSEGYGFQAALYLRGVPSNAFKHSVTKVVNNDEFRTFIEAGGANVGERFELEKFFYDKVIIMSDGDSDGNAIFSSFCAFLLLYFRPLVEAGRVYRVLPPLYKIDDKASPFILNKTEYFKVFLRRIGDNIKVMVDGKLVSPKDFLELLERNRDYLEELTRISKYFGAHMDLVEFITIHMNDKDFGKKLNKKFPEINLVNDKEIEGVYEGRYQYIKMSKRFKKYIEGLLDILMQKGNTSAYFEVHKRTSGDQYTNLGIMTMGQLMKICEQYKPEILDRYKGLGELKAEELRETTLDPNNRILIRLTVEDIEKTMEQMSVLHGDDTQSRAKRKELIGGYKIRRDELDN